MAAVLSPPSNTPPLNAIKNIATNVAGTAAAGHFSVGKYKGIVIAVGFFLLFDLGVLILNFYTSFQIAEDAVGITMPEMDGIECIQALIKFDPKINILVVSALSDKSTAIQALKLGARGFVSKPFSDEELQMALLDVSDAR